MQWPTSAGSSPPRPIIMQEQLKESAKRVEATDLLPGTILVVAPHMDDEVLACGGTIALLPEKTRVHVLYATDGMRSPAPILPEDAITPDLGDMRVRESIEAMGVLGVPAENLHFLRLPEAELEDHLLKLRQGLLAQISSILPKQILLPFRFDRHPDHLAINRLLTEAAEHGELSGELIEYFVYYRWRLLPKRDVRLYIRPSYLMKVDTSAASALKRLSLDCFRTQTTRFYDWQTRPILRETLLDEVSRSPEYFVRYDSSLAGAAIFAGSVAWIRLVHHWEPHLQKWKYLLGARLLRRARLQ